MCLIAVIPQNHEPITDEWIRDIYKRNNDGFGFMWMKPVKNGRQLYTWKDTGKVGKFLSAFRTVEAEADGEWAVHTRMATHGRVEPDMAHPYPVDAEKVGDSSIVMMHNGILSHGNDADRKKSDTWHYIKDYLRPLLAKFGTELLDDPAFQRLVGSDIGGNRFVFMATDGRLRIINRDQGLTWHGLWLSNTYAWDARGFGAVAPLPSRVYPAYNSTKGGSKDSDKGGINYDGWASWWEDEAPPKPTTPKQSDLLLPGAGVDVDAVIADIESREALASDTIGEHLKVSQKGVVLPGSAIREARSFLELLEDLGYPELVDSLSEETVARWIRDIGANEYVRVVQDICDYTVDPQVLFAARLAA